MPLTKTTGASALQLTQSDERIVADLIRRQRQYEQGHVARQERTAATAVGSQVQALAESHTRGKSPAQRGVEIDELVGQWQRRIGSRLMEVGPLVRLAAAVVDGPVKLAAVLEAWADLDAKVPRGDAVRRSKFANGCIKKILWRAGVRREKPR